jgi:hypothetical protein
MRLARHSGDYHLRFAKVGLRFGRGVLERHEHLALTQLSQPHILFDDRVAADVGVFLAQPVEDPLGSPNPRIHLYGVHFSGVPQNTTLRKCSMEPVSWRSGFAPPETPLTRRLLIYFPSGE